MPTTPNRRAGRIWLTIDGRQYDAAGSFTYDIGGVKREAIAGADQVHGFSEAVAVPYIEGAITDASDLDLGALKAIEDTTVTLELANGKTITLRNAWFAAEGKVSTEKSEIEVRFEGREAKEMGAS